VPVSASENASTSVPPSTSDRSSALRRRSGGRFSMSHASLIAWRSAPITPLAAASSSRIGSSPRLPALSSALTTVPSSRSRSASVDSGTLSKVASTTRLRSSSSSKKRPNPPTSSRPSGTAESTTKKAI
jgi:hypothetical protein